MLLLTAFEPFDGTGLNSSEQALREFLRRHPREISGVPLASTTLPVAFDEDVRALRRFCESLSQPPRAILHLGQTGGPLVAVEMSAANLKFDRGDMDASAIDSDAPSFLDSTFPAPDIMRALQSAGVPCCASQDAGVYLCNHILFRSLQQAQQAAREGRAAARSIGFLHLPRLWEQRDSQSGGPEEPESTLPLPTLALAVTVAARTMAEHLKPESS